MLVAGPQRFAHVCTSVLLIAGLLFVAARPSRAQDANATATYEALRGLTLSGESVSVSNFDLKRDAGTFRTVGHLLFRGAGKRQSDWRGVRRRWSISARASVRIGA